MCSMYYEKRHPLQPCIALSIILIHVGAWSTWPEQKTFDQGAGSESPASMTRWLDHPKSVHRIRFVCFHHGYVLWIRRVSCLIVVLMCFWLDRKLDKPYNRHIVDTIDLWWTIDGWTRVDDDAQDVNENATRAELPAISLAWKRARKTFCIVSHSFTLSLIHFHPTIQSIDINWHTPWITSFLRLERKIQ